MYITGAHKIVQLKTNEAFVMLASQYILPILINGLELLSKTFNQYNIILKLIKYTLFKLNKKKVKY